MTGGHSKFKDPSQLYYCTYMWGSVTYWPSTELSVKRCTCVNNRCIRSKISGYHLDLKMGWIRWNCDAHGKQLYVKQLYNQVPQTVWVSSSCSSRQWETAPDIGLGPSGTRLCSLAEWGRIAAILRGTWGQYVAVFSVSNSLLTHNQYQPFRNPFENKVWEVYFFLKKRVRSSLLLIMFPLIYVYV